MNRPIALIDPDGRDPVRNQFGSTAQVATIFSRSDTERLTIGWAFGNPLSDVPQNNLNSAHRYIPLGSGFVIDMQHVIAAAALSGASLSGDRLDGWSRGTSDDRFTLSVFGGLANELWHSLNRHPSAFALEDKESNLFGAHFEAYVYDGRKPLGPQLKKHLDWLGAISVDEF